MEYGLRLWRPQNLPADPREMYSGQWRDLLPSGSLRALYFGTEFCETLLPAVDEAKKFCALAASHGSEAVLLTPIVTQAGLKGIDRLLTELGNRGLAPGVTFNDWGVLNLLREAHPRLKRTAGRLLNRGIRDPRLNPEPHSTDGLTENIGERLRALLTGFGVSGIESDSDHEGCYLQTESSGLQRALHFPYVFVASGRNCLVKAESMPADQSFTKGLAVQCSAPCRGRYFSEQRADTEQPLLRAGNTIFYETSRACAEVNLSCCDRLVLHERPIP